MVCCCILYGKFHFGGLFDLSNSGMWQAEGYIIQINLFTLHSAQLNYKNTSGGSGKSSSGLIKERVIKLE